MRLGQKLALHVKPLVHGDDFARGQVAYYRRAQRVERAGFGSEHYVAAESADTQRLEPHGVAHRDKLVVGEHHERISPHELAARPHYAFFDAFVGVKID